MPKYIIVSFLFLGLAFYELSGGADFEPRGTRPAAEERVARAEPVEPVTKRAPKQDRAQDIVAKQVISTRNAPAVAADDNTELTTAEANSEGLLRVAAGYNTDFGFDSDPTRTITLASLGQTTTSLQVVRDSPLRNRQVATPAAAEYVSPGAATTPEVQRDIREVTGTRVNMRMGPGTNYPVITRLNLGHEVEVLESGNGWLRLRVLPEQTVGWISASLVSDKTD
ncbi:SH3 domain-containing protein [Lutimaribacter marinistellae]|uniref:SH3 domain-containing protein n=1 Tax=Lutimaribacter marinistellae TaxID=1820329 RepID=A0ABV7TEZ1_9RHOB